MNINRATVKCQSNENHVENMMFMFDSCTHFEESPHNSKHIWCFVCCHFLSFQSCWRFSIQCSLFSHQLFYFSHACFHSGLKSCKLRMKRIYPLSSVNNSLSLQIIHNNARNNTTVQSSSTFTRQMTTFSTTVAHLINSACEWIQSFCRTHLDSLFWVWQIELPVTSECVYSVST